MFMKVFEIVIRASFKIKCPFKHVLTWTNIMMKLASIDLMVMSFSLGFNELF